MNYSKKRGWCSYCKHYREYNLENECVATGDYCYPAHKMENCEHFEWDDHIREVAKMLESEE